MSLIGDILTASRARLEERKRARPIESLKSEVASAPRAATRFRDALEAATFSVIAEVKAKSPSRGRMDEENVRKALGVYRESSSVSAISILTDWDYFGNTVEDLVKARAATDKPILRKDFIVDEYQVWEARAFGADAILLMAGVLAARDPGQIRGLYDLAIDLGMDVLFEIGMIEKSVEIQAQVKRVPPDATIWGVNSRRFDIRPPSRFSLRARLGRFLRKDLSTSRPLHEELIGLIPKPKGKLIIAESGIKKASEVNQLAECGYRAALIGTAFLQTGVKVDKVVKEFDLEIAREHSQPGIRRLPTAQPI